jgi:transposase
MDIVHTHCAGLDVHKKTGVAWVITPKATGGWQKEIHTFETMTADLWLHP